MNKWIYVRLYDLCAEWNEFQLHKLPINYAFSDACCNILGYLDPLFNLFIVDRDWKTFYFADSQWIHPGII